MGCGERKTSFPLVKAYVRFMFKLGHSSMSTDWPFRVCHCHSIWPRIGSINDPSAAGRLAMSGFAHTLAVASDRQSGLAVPGAPEYRISLSDGLAGESLGPGSHP